jgi:hypothetical protein
MQKAGCCPVRRCGLNRFRAGVRGSAPPPVVWRNRGTKLKDCPFYDKRNPRFTDMFVRAARTGWGIPDVSRFDFDWFFFQTGPIRAGKGGAVPNS